MTTRSPSNKQPSHKETPVTVDGVSESTTRRSPHRSSLDQRTKTDASHHEHPGDPAAGPEPQRRRPRRIAKYPATYRLPIEVLDLIDDVVDDAAARGARLSKEDAVAEAIVAHYGSLTRNGA